MRETYIAELEKDKRRLDYLLDTQKVPILKTRKIIDYVMQHERYDKRHKPNTHIQAD
jgi:hypothetical protein